MTAPPGNAPPRPRRAFPFVLFASSLILLGAMGVHDIEVFSEIQFRASNSGVEYLVARHQSLDPFEGDGFTILHRERGESGWNRGLRLSGSYTALAVEGEDLVVFHGTRCSTYRRGARTSHRDLAIGWSVRAAVEAPEGGLLLFGFEGSTLLAATLRGKTTGAATPGIAIGEDPGPLRAVRKGEHTLVLWAPASEGSAARDRIAIARADLDGLAMADSIASPVEFQSFEAADAGERIFVYLRSRDPSAERDLVHQAEILDDLRFAPVVPVELPGRRLIGNRILGLGATTTPGGRTRLFVSTLSSIRAFDVDTRTGQSEAEEEIISLTHLATGRIVAWLAGLVVFSAILLWTGLRMFGTRLRARPARS